ncbi:putative short-chain dehydrogenase [Calycina marina]|uniref:Short-chain dehydrogenase n=1 Tax=Calycina marina TaxID=1763456 RepID=A0A9P8CAZ1_9HELO|nr:putative short-chain dehydrogenase [Calycina marina]
MTIADSGPYSQSLDYGIIVISKQFSGFFRSQFTRLPYPAKIFAGKTIIITGSNSSLGLAAAKHLARLSAHKLIIAVRTPSKGDVAVSCIQKPVPDCTTVFEVWPLDLESHASIAAFVQRCQALERLDVVVLNAGVMTEEWVLVEGNERQVAVNVVGTMVLGVGLLPKMRETARLDGGTPVMTFTGSFTHWMTSFPQRTEKRIFEGLKREKKDARMDDRDRYKVSKLMQLFCVRELAVRVTASDKDGKIIVSTVNPGFAIFYTALKLTIARSVEVDSRTLLNAAEGGEETHGAYLNDCEIGRQSDFVFSEEDAATQKRTWAELSDILERIEPGIMENIQ